MRALFSLAEYLHCIIKGNGPMDRRKIRKQDSATAARIPSVISGK